jgi:hypothetical protein
VGCGISCGDEKGCGRGRDGNVARTWRGRGENVTSSTRRYSPVQSP